MSWYIISFFGFIFTSQFFFIFSSSPVLTSSIDVVFVLSIRLKNIHRRGDYYNAITTAFPPGYSVITPKGNAPNAPNQPVLPSPGLFACGDNIKHLQRSPPWLTAPPPPPPQLHSCNTPSIIAAWWRYNMPYGTKVLFQTGHLAPPSSTLPCWETSDNKQSPPYTHLYQQPHWSPQEAPG